MIISKYRPTSDFQENLPNKPLISGNRGEMIMGGLLAVALEQPNG
jgi:hypothetical protein